MRTGTPCDGTRCPGFSFKLTAGWKALRQQVSWSHRAAISTRAAHACCVARHAYTVLCLSRVTPYFPILSIPSLSFLLIPFIPGRERDIGDMAASTVVGRHTAPLPPP